MIKTETLMIDGRECIRTYSDAGVKIHGGFPEADYDEAVDPADSGRTYVETDIPIDESDAEPEELLNILVGEEQ